MAIPDLSLAFYQYLCDVIGTEDVVNTRRRIFTTIDNTYSSKLITFICSGSKAEGLDINGSDFDMMTVFHFIPVFENKNEVRKFGSLFPCVMDTSDCKPGFTQLKQHNVSFNYLTYAFCEYKAGEWYFSSLKFRENQRYNINLKDYLIPHGPCLSTRDGQIDHANCVRCKDWISQAQPWILRSGHLCTCNKVIKNIVEFGTLFVPVGCKNSPNVDLEWRISFSYAEKLLIWSFNHVQLLSYALLKVLLKDIIKQTTGDLLCSYFLKTVMLWICEETKSSQWKANNILSCFMSCFDRLIYFVRYKTCAHYFIPENDLFAERFDEQQHRLLLSTLNNLKSLGWKCLLQTQTLWSFRAFLEPVALPLTLPVSHYRSVYWLEAFDHIFCFPDLKHTIYYYMRANKKIFYIYMISSINRCISKKLTIIDRRVRFNKQLYNIYRKRLCHLLIGLHHDAVCGWLLLASFFYVNKQYQICMQLLTDYLLWCTPGKHPSNEQQTSLSRLEIKAGFRRLSVLKKYVIDNIVFSPESYIFPKELHELCDGKERIMTPILFGSVLHFLCCHRLANSTVINKYLLDFEKMILSGYFRYDEFKQNMAYKLLSIAYSMRRDTN